jgi:predicted dehydrogenase
MLSTYHNRHWDGCILRAVKAIRGGAIGEVVRVEAHMGSWGKPGDWWRSSKSISGGILYDWGVHQMEYTLQIVDAEIIEVAGFVKTGVWAPKVRWKDDTNEDEGFVVVRYANGAWSTLTITRLDANPKPGWIEVTGTKGTYLMESRTWTIITPKAGGGKVTRTGANPPGRWEKYYRNVADHLAAGAKLVITPEWARRPVHVLDLACRSAAAGKALRAKYA